MGQFNDYLRAQLHKHYALQEKILEENLPQWLVKFSKKHPTIARVFLSKAVKITSRTWGDIVEVKYFGKTVFIDPLYAKQKKKLGTNQ